MKPRILILVMVAFSVMAGDTVVHNHDQSSIAKELEPMPASEGHLFLYSLDPHHHQSSDTNVQRFFHGFVIMGKAETTDDQEKAVLLKSFTQGIREKQSPGRCFLPRHGLQIIVGSSTNDFVICFECHRVQAFGFRYSDFLIADSPSNAFNESVNRHHLKTAKSP